MVNRDFMCIIWFGFIKWRTAKDIMMEGRNVIEHIMSTNVNVNRDRTYYVQQTY